MLEMHLATLKPTARVEPLICFETQPGQQLQADFASIRSRAERLSVFVATLGWNRVAYAEFIGDERLETQLSCHEHAFDYFGGLLHNVLYDNSTAQPRFEKIYSSENFLLRLGTYRLSG